MILKVRWDWRRGAGGGQNGKLHHAGLKILSHKDMYLSPCLPILMTEQSIMSWEEAAGACTPPAHKHWINIFVRGKHTAL